MNHHRTPPMLGYLWLIDHFHLPAYPLPHRSHLGTRLSVQEKADGSVDAIYPASYAVPADPVAHLRFALKYDGVHPQVLLASFEALGDVALAAAIERRPTGKYSRLLGFWFEWLTGRSLPCPDAAGGAYVPALPPEDYVCFSDQDVSALIVARASRWRVVNNLPGTRGWFPLIRRTEKIRAAMDRDPAPDLRSLAGRYPTELFRRASDYLYLKETRSSWQIEREQPSQDRAERFVGVLHRAGERPLGERLGEAGLCELQNQIVDARYAETSFRAVQNYVGETRPDYSERVHYVCPPPDCVGHLMADWADAQVMARLLGWHPVVQAAACAFGFVFIHPFEDGNGRLHRYLIHEILNSHRWGVPGLVLPLSATILRRIREYDLVLEDYSKPILQIARIEFDADRRLRVLNADVLSGNWRWPDLTRQVEFLFETIELCLREDLPQELSFLQGYDRARRSLREVVDMPDRRLDLLLRLLHQNGGALSKAKRAQFGEITEAELQRMEAAYREAMTTVLPAEDGEPSS